VIPDEAIPTNFGGKAAALPNGGIYYRAGEAGYANLLMIRFTIRFLA